MNEMLCQNIQRGIQFRNKTIVSFVSYITPQNL